MLDDVHRRLAESSRFLGEGDVGSAISALEVAVRAAITALESALGKPNFGAPLAERFASFTDDPNIVNAAKVIEELFDPTIIPVGFDQGTEEPHISPGQAAMALRYAEALVDFVEKKLGGEG